MFGFHSDSEVKYNYQNLHLRPKTNVVCSRFACVYIL